jgi:Protein of unknown function (DUF1186)/SEC-C motif
MKAIIEDAKADIFVRSALLKAMHALMRKGQQDRETVVAYHAHILALCCTPGHEEFAELAVMNAARTQESSLRPMIDRCYAEGLIDTTLIPQRDIDAFFNDPQNEIDAELLQNERFEALIDYIATWPWFTDKHGDGAIGDDGGISVARRLAWSEGEPYVRPTAKIGRNDLCHCGSEKKYKKCCLPIDQLH